MPDDGLEGLDVWRQALGWGRDHDALGRELRGRAFAAAYDSEHVRSEVCRPLDRPRDLALVTPAGSGDPA